MRRLLGFTLFLFLILSLRFFFSSQNHIEYVDEEDVVIETTLLSEPKKYFSSLGFFIESRGNRIFILTSKKSTVHYGDYLRITGKIQKKVEKDRSIRLSLYYPEIKVIKNRNQLLAVASLVRQKIRSGFENTLPPIPASLLLGIVLGGRESMPPDFVEDLKNSGVIHVVAASGMNVTLVAGFLYTTLMVFLKRKLALAGSICGIFLYAILSGLEPSIVRASLMGTVLFGAQFFGRQNLPIYSLVLAAFAMLMVSPNLLSDVGFQLSFASTVGILYIKPLFERGKRVKKLLERSIIGGDITTTLAAQIAALPILFATFGSYSLLSVVVNAAVLWTVPILMVLGGLAAVSTFISEPFSRLFLYLSLPLLWYFEKSITFFGRYPSQVLLSDFPNVFWIGYYFLLMAMVLAVKKHEKDSTS